MRRLVRAIPCWAALVAFAAWATGFVRVAHEVLEHGGAGHAHVAQAAAPAHDGGHRHGHGHHHHHHHDRDPEPWDDDDDTAADATSPGTDRPAAPADHPFDSHHSCAVCVAIAGVVAAGVDAPADVSIGHASEPATTHPTAAPVATTHLPVPPARGPPA